MSNQVFLEALGGGFFSFGGAMQTGRFALSLRWDFVKNTNFILFTLFGLQGEASGSLGYTQFMMHPKFGVGLIYYFVSFMGIRLDVSPDYITAGVTGRLFP
jgi:hypothetical protein